MMKLLWFLFQGWLVVLWLLLCLVDSVLQVLKFVMLILQIGFLVLFVIIILVLFSMISCVVLLMVWVFVEQVVMMVWFGFLKLNWIEICFDIRLISVLGIKNGDMCLVFFFLISMVVFVIEVRLLMFVLIIMLVCLWFLLFLGIQLEFLMVCCVVVMLYRMKLLILWWFFGFIQLLGLNVLLVLLFKGILQVYFVVMFDVLNCVIGLVLDFLVRSCVQVFLML